MCIRDSIHESRLTKHPHTHDDVDDGRARDVTLTRAHRMSLASAQFSRACAPAATRASRRGRRSTVVVRAGVFGASSTTATTTRIGTQGTRAKGSRRTRRTGGARGERRRERARVARGGREIDELSMFYARADVTVSDTKQKFLQAYPYPIPSVWSTITQELLVQGHFAKYNVKSEYLSLIHI